jgi:hypothetical protein
MQCEVIINPRGFAQIVSMHRGKHSFSRAKAQRRKERDHPTTKLHFLREESGFEEVVLVAGADSVAVEF